MILLRVPARLARSWFLPQLWLFFLCLIAPIHAHASLTYVGTDFNSALAVAGVREGDELFRWKAGAEAGVLESGWDLQWAWLRHGHCGCVVVEGRRANEALTWELKDGAWTFNLLPSGVRNSDMAKALRAVAEQDWVAAMASFDRADAAISALDWETRTWLRYREAFALARSGHHDAAAAKAGSANDLALGQPNLSLSKRALNYLALASVLGHAKQPDPAVAAIRSALALPDLPVSLIPRIRYQQGDVLLVNNRIEPAREALLAAESALAEGFDNSFLAAAIHVRLARIHFMRSELADAAKRNAAALAIYNNVVGGPRDKARVWVLSGRIKQDQGDLDGASSDYEEAEAFLRPMGEDSIDMASLRINQGAIAKFRGDLKLADELYFQSLQVHERRAPGTSTHALVLNNIANVASDREDLGRAEEYFARALEIFERDDANSMEAALARMNLGVVAARTGRMEQALAYYRSSFEIRNKLAPTSLETAQNMSNIGAALSDLGRLEEADEAYGRALDIMQSAAPSGLYVAQTLYARAYLTYKMKNYDRALAMAHESLAIRLKRIPESVRTAQVQSRLAQYYEAAGQPAESRRYACAAADTLDKQKQRLGGTQYSQAAFSRHYARFYGTCVRKLIEAGQARRAFDYSENYRGYFLLRMMSERELSLDTSASSEISKAYRELAQQYVDLTRRRAFLEESASDEARRQLDLQMSETDSLMAVQRERLRQSNPRLAELRYPQAIKADELQRAVGPDTVVLSYLVTEDAILLIAVSSNGLVPDGVWATVIEQEHAALEALVNETSAAIFRRDGSDIAASRRVYKLVFQPIVHMLKPGDHVMIMTDGPLNTLSFAGLVTSESGPAKYLVEDYVVSYALSGTVSKQLAALAARPPEALVGFGDPVYAGQDGKASAVTGSRSLQLTRLPETRQEIRGISSLFGDLSQSFLAAEATEKNMRAQSEQAGILHVAAHGIYDPKYPLDSAIALTPNVAGATEDDGFLRAWEIFEDIRLHANLVALSACETAIGLDSGGEGLIGLQRAFQYAGAQSVLASVWNVADRPTSNLMVTFYQHYLAGHSWPAALRLAQLEMLTGSNAGSNSAERGIGGLASEQAGSQWADPYYWAAWRLTR